MTISKDPNPQPPEGLATITPDTGPVWHAGNEDPMPIRKLPDAPASMHIIGPAMILVALGVGLGETYMWPRLVILFGPEIRWLFLIGVTLQAFVMVEMARYAMATGESIFFGAARVFKPLMWFFFIVAMAVYIWPGHMAAGAEALELITGIPWLISAIVGLLLIGIVFSFAKVVYNLVEKLLSVLMGFLVIGSAIVAAMVGHLSDLTSTITGMFAIGYLPPEAMSATLVPRHRRSDRVRGPVRHAADVVHPVSPRQGRRNGCAPSSDPRPRAHRRGGDHAVARVHVRHRRRRRDAEVEELEEVGLQ